MAVADGDDYIINGSKVFITNGWMCDVVIVCAKTDPSKGAHGMSLFIVENGMKGGSLSSRMLSGMKDGLSGSPTVLRGHASGA